MCCQLCVRAMKLAALHVYVDGNEYGHKELHNASYYVLIQTVNVPCGVSETAILSLPNCELMCDRDAWIDIR